MDSELPSASFFDRFTYELAFLRKWDELRRTKKSIWFYEDFSKQLYGDPC
jgi:hypothetical protein